MPSFGQRRDEPAILRDQLRALLQQQRYAEMIPLLQRATELAPNSFASWDGLSQVYAKLGRWQDTLDACERALAINPGSVILP